jgi:hypothetical protein
MTEPEKLEQAKNKTKKLLDTYFDLKNYTVPLESFIENPYVDPLRLSPGRMIPELFLWRPTFYIY